ncbi:MAG: hypothetical protein FWE11_09335 [Defluviitaleaceae bacterium]|nr:hypothetical protein [Defluviitaleaceae bacterium]
MKACNLNKMAKDVVEKYNLEHPVEIRFIDLASEIGELGKELLKISNYGKDACQPSSDISGEIGDVLFSLACIANSLDIDLEDALASAISKYHARFAIAGSISSCE